MIDGKAAIRREMKARRRRLDAAERAAAAAVVCGKLEGRGDVCFWLDPLDFGGPLAVYLAGGDEVDVDPYIARMLRDGVSVVAPRWNGETYELARLKGLDEKHIRRGPMGIREPVDADVVPPKDVDAWIVPGLAFTKDGRRLGYGGGWYDRLLAQAPKHAVKVGVAYSFQIVDDLPSEPHDVRLTAVVDDSLDDAALEFTESADGFSAKIALTDAPRRRRFAARCLWGMALSLAIGPGGLFALVKAGLFDLPNHFVFAVLFVFLLGFAVAFVALVRMLASFVEADISVSRGAGVCRRRLFGRLPLPVRRFVLTPWSKATGLCCGSATGECDLAPVLVYRDGEGVSPPRTLVRACAHTSMALALRINLANKWDDAAYKAARRARLSKLPRGMKTFPAPDGRGRVAVIHPRSLHDLLPVAFTALVAETLASFVFQFAPNLVGCLFLAVVSALVAAWCLFIALRGLFGVARCEVGGGRMDCAAGIWPFMRRGGVSLEGRAPPADRDGFWWHDLQREAGGGRNLFGWLPQRYDLPLRLFVEEALDATAERKSPARP